MKSNTGTVCYPFPYSAVDGCLFVEKANKNGTTTKKLCNFLPYLKCDINVDDGVEQTRTFRIAGVHESGRLLPEIEVTVKEFGKMDSCLHPKCSAYELLLHDSLLQHYYIIFLRFCRYF